MSDITTRNEISVIREMIEKTRRDTAESGHFFIYIGIFSLLGTIAAGLMEHYSLKSWLIPIFIFIALINAGIAYRIIYREKHLHAVTTYAKTLSWNLWLSCGIAALFILFVFPFLHVYAFSAVPVLVSVIMGIALYVTGSILEIPFLQWTSLVWISGACLMALTLNFPGFIIMSAVIIGGWITPGFMLNRRYRKERRQP